MSAQPQPTTPPYATPEEYLTLERAASYKSEYYQGQITAMSGASRAHNLLVSTLIMSLGSRLGDSCNVFPSDMRVHVPANGLYTYPDVSVVCGPEQYQDDAHLDTLLNPVVLIEVLSVTTEKNDRSSKFLLYKSIPGLQHYVLVESLRVGVGVYSRGTEPDVWEFRDYRTRAATVALPALGIELPLTELYRRLELPDSAA
jgi:Uma2 family endonuclease